MDTTIKQYGKLDVLVNNAGNLGHGSIKDDHVLEEFDRDFDLLIRPVVELIHLSIPHLEKSKGTIINISSIGSLAPVL
jgi:NAD(P)-dependent dehydrogenase (short-subunit alcohol dehydrogenase family)